MRLVKTGLVATAVSQLFAVLAPSPASASSMRPASLAPIGLERDETLAVGEFRASYRYKRSDFGDLRNGGADRRPPEIFAAGFTEAPIRMLVEEHEFGLYAAVLDRLTLRASIPYRRIEMTTESLGGVAPFTLHSDGVGDLRIGLIHEFMEKGDERLDLLFDLIAPTGSIRVRDNAPGRRERVPYVMRPGSGSFALETGLNYQGHTRYVGWGGQATTLFRLHRNDLRYQEGNRYAVTGWLTQAWAQWFNTSQRLEWSKWGNVHGSDDELSRVTPANDPKAQGGERLDLAFGVELAPELFGRQRLAFETGIPMLQSLDGPQLELDWWIQLGWRLAF